LNQKVVEENDADPTFIAASYSNGAADEHEYPQSEYSSPENPGLNPNLTDHDADCC
jgi:hypothetical protein